ncbi:hypothetical protein NEUTE1DRAFT_112577 [Neurospora tetrasperma FGSC 2508]|uniref:Uncharacterized protein n=1 Tax=Neurospora tetrasperma (strain FGSC 2508 / ATCC MYA-4615 / P0657) TaxID=510951 RepID=F8MVW3_NEUT8|nr:uncharacterized protein NEUTE1DRAFT_112577 [Neurospora tetrasperma FGSC 2508]EGO54011.1 hypothetical protein NEUTE1DRAFT_112577 [Neurospora tetrasperma FGSC 2508]
MSGWWGAAVNLPARRTSVELTYTMATTYHRTAGSGTGRESGYRGNERASPDYAHFMFRNLVPLPNIEQVFLKQAKTARGSKGKAMEPDSNPKTPKSPADVIQDVVTAQRGGKWSIKGTATFSGGAIKNEQRAKRLNAELGVLARRHGGAAQELFEEVEQELAAFYTEVDHAKATYRNNKAFYSELPVIMDSGF